MQELLCSRCDCPVHPVAGLAFANAFEEHALQLKSLPDQLIETYSFNDHIAANDSGGRGRDRKRCTNRAKYLDRKKCDLSLVVLLILEKAVAPNTLSRDAFNFRALHHGICPCRLTVMAEEVVSTRDEQVPNHGGIQG